MASKLADYIKRVETWPEQAQEQALASLRSIEDELHEGYDLSAEDKRSIDRGLADARADRFVSDEEMARLFARFRQE